MLKLFKITPDEDPPNVRKPNDMTKQFSSVANAKPRKVTLLKASRSLAEGIFSGLLFFCRNEP